MLITFISEPAFSADSPNPPGPDYLYKTTFVRAAPGKLLDLIALWKARLPVYDAAGDERPLWWRHTQGDQWDLMLLFPMESYAGYYAKDRISRREKAGRAAGLSPMEFQQQLDACSSWKEDVFVMGPPLEPVKNAFESSAYYHIEIFISLPGKQAELHREREMENAYQVGIGRPYNWIFVCDQGAAWDMYTLGCYRDLQQWAASSDFPKEKRDEIARRAGFADADAIGPYLRTLIDMHRDTMGVAIK
ncbi:MAG: hypothetical protein A2W03_06000 [Candidatus Aminicenantes bacterium RBG_16_63_16]|nr:MAG: hypothetical protein A2W03_06000 [Candidatus Aminicenantes bacterium RBG_16_63_16]